MTKKAHLPPQPGDADGPEYWHRMLRVNQAGEYGAVRIYEGQLAALRCSHHPDAAKAVKLVEHMAEQERAHLDYFNRLLPERRVRPTLLQPLWHVGGFLLGAATAAMGPKAAMACTVAVEQVIDEHYAEQVARIDEADAELKAKLAQFRAEEMEHHDTGLAEGATAAPAYPLLHAAVSGITRLAIELTKKF